MCGEGVLISLASAKSRVWNLDAHTALLEAGLSWSLGVTDALGWPVKRMATCSPSFISIGTAVE